MKRTAAIRIKAEIVISYDRQQFGAATKAEIHCEAIRAAIAEELNAATLVKWEAEHTSVEQY